MQYPNTSIPMTPIQSSTISAVGYDEAKKELHVDFHKTGRYVYHNVSKEKFESMTASDSHGKFFHSEIKGNHHHTKHG